MHYINDSVKGVLPKIVGLLRFLNCTLINSFKTFILSQVLKKNEQDLEEPS